MIHCLSLSLCKAPEKLRKALLYSEVDVRKASEKLEKTFRSPFVLLLTCNRAEMYSVNESELSPFSSALSLNALAVKEYAEHYEGKDAVKHLFLLSSGILSEYYGEDVILSQISSALEMAKKLGNASFELDHLFRSALSFGKDVRKRFDVRVFDWGLIDEVKKRIPPSSSVLVIGTGALARMLSSSLLSDGHDVVETIRDTSKIGELIPYGVKAVPYGDVASCLDRDVIISASSKIGYTLSEECLGKVRGKLLFDLAHPSDLPPSFGAITDDDLCYPTPKRDEVKAKVLSLFDESYLRYSEETEKTLNHPAVEQMAYDGAAETVRRMKGLIKEESLEDALFESARKAFITSYYRNLRRR